MDNFKLIQRQYYEDNVFEHIESVFVRGIMLRGSTEEVLTLLSKELGFKVQPVVQYYDYSVFDNGNDRCYIIPIGHSDKCKTASYSETIYADTLYIFTKHYFMIVKSQYLCIIDTNVNKFCVNAKFVKYNKLSVVGKGVKKGVKFSDFKHLTINPTTCEIKESFSFS